MPRVLFVIDSLEVGGAERSLLELCRHLRRFDPVVCHLSPKAALAPSFDAAGVPTLGLGLETRYPLLAGARALTRSIRSVDPDLIHSTLYTAGITARLAARGNRPLAHTWVNEPVIHPRRPGGAGWRRRLAHMLEARTAFRVTHFIANSRAVAESNRRALGVSAERVSVVHRGRDPDRFVAPPQKALEALRWELGLAPEDRVVLNVGRLRAQKGQETLLAALPRILGEAPDVRLVLVGEGPERPALERRIEVAGLKDRVFLTGQRDDVPALLGLAEVFAFPSHHEGHPGALVEAMLAGCPTVASDLPVHRETLEEPQDPEDPATDEPRRRSGLLVPPDDPAALAEAVLRLLSRPDEARSLGDAARRTARLRFDIRDVARQHEDLYQRLLQPLPSILQVVTRRQLRGAEVFAGQLSRNLATAGHRVRLVGLYPPGEPPLETPGVATVDLFPRTASGVSPRLVLRLAREIRRFDPDVLQANGSDTLKYSVLARRASGRRPKLLYRNISLASRWLRTPLHRWWNRRLLHAVDHVVAVSERSREDLRVTYGLPESLITLIPRAVETRLPDPSTPPREALAKATGCDPTAPVIVHLGSFTPEKNHRGMLDVLSLVHRTRGDAQLVFFGDGPLRDEVRAEIERQGLGSRAFCPGALPNAADLTAGADLLLLFSLVEGMPGVVLEAGARGVPVVVSDVGGVREVVADGETGRLVAAGDLGSCAAAILELLDDGALRRRLGEALRATVRARYDLEVITDRYRVLYRSVLNEDGTS